MKKILILCWGLMFSLPAIAQQLQDTTVCEGTVIESLGFRYGSTSWYDSDTSQIPVELNNTLQNVALFHDSTFYYVHIENGVTSERLHFTIFVNKPPTATFIYTKDGLKVHFGVAGKQKLFKYQWVIFDLQQKVFTGDSLEYEFKVYGDFAVVLNTQDSIGCFGSDTQIISLRYSQYLTACKGDTLSLSAVFGINMYDSIWIYTDTLSHPLLKDKETYNTHLDNDLLLYYVGFKSGRKFQIGVLKFKVYPIPGNTFTYNQVGNTVYFSADSIYGYIQDWDFGDGEVSTLASPVHIYKKPGKYILKHSVTTVYGCYSGAVFDTIIIEASSIQGEAQSLSKFLTLYPNPAKKAINIKYDLKQAGPCQFELLDIHGRTLKSFDCTGRAGENTQGIDIESLGLMEGVYFIRVLTTTGSHTAMFIKQP